MIKLFKGRLLSVDSSHGNSFSSVFWLMFNLKDVDPLELTKRNYFALPRRTKLNKSTWLARDHKGISSKSPLFNTFIQWTTNIHLQKVAPGKLWRKKILPKLAKIYTLCKIVNDLGIRDPQGGSFRPPQQRTQEDITKKVFDFRISLVFQADQAQFNIINNWKSLFSDRKGLLMRQWLQHLMTSARTYTILRSFLSLWVILTETWLKTINVITENAKCWWQLSDVHNCWKSKQL